MKPKLLGWLAGSAAVMLLLPWVAVTFVNSNAGMAVTLLLFFVIDPIYAGVYLVIGIVSMVVSSRIRAKKHG